MTSRYHLAPDATTCFTSDGAVLERADGFQVTQDPLPSALLAALTSGPRSAAELRAALDPEYSAPSVYRSLEALARAGGVLALPTPLTPSLAARWRRLGVSPAEAAVAVMSHSTEVLGAPDAVRPLADALREWGLVARPSPRSLRAYVTTDPLTDNLAAVNAEALNARVPWMLVSPCVEGAWVTAFRAGQTPCWACLAVRLRYNTPTRTLSGERHQGGVALGRSVADRLARWIATLAARGSVPEVEGEWSRVSADPTRAPERHPFDRLSGCAACGTPEAAPLNWAADATQKTSAQDYRRLVSPVTGIVRGVRLLNTQGGAYAAVARFRFPGMTPTLERLMRNEQHVSGGKGWTPHEAAAGATFEGVERIAGCYRPDLEVLDATAAELGEGALLPHHVDRFSAAQRAAPSPAGPPTALTVPHRLPPDHRTEWVRAWPLLDHAGPCWYPAAAAFYGFPFQGPRFAIASSNGCAAGPTVAAAVVGGFLELVERDAVAIWHYNRIVHPALDLGALGEDRLVSFCTALAANGRRFALLDLSTDIPVPVVAAISRRQEGKPGWVFGFGAAGTYAEAALRATSELAQLLPATDARGVPSPVAWADTASAEEHPHFVPCAASLSTQGRAPEGSIDLERVKGIVQASGLEGYVVDQTHALTSIPVVRVLVPGLVHLWKRLGFERLYDVPVQLGWQPKATPEHALNPLHLTI